MSQIDWSIGMRVQAHPATDTWMRGDRYGEVTKITRAYVYVRLDLSGRVMRFPPQNLLVVETPFGQGQP